MAGEVIRHYSLQKRSGTPDLPFCNSFLCILYHNSHRCEFNSFESYLDNALELFRHERFEFNYSRGKSLLLFRYFSDLLLEELQ